MKLLDKSFQKGNCKIEITHLDDLWTLSQILEVGDFVSGQTQRKLKIGDAATDRNVKVSKKWMKLKITIEKIEYEATRELLRVNGPIFEGNNDVAKGEHHTFALEPGINFRLEKPKGFDTAQKQRLLDAEKDTHQKMLLVVCDRESAHLAWLQSFGIEHIGEMKGNVEKKVEGSNANENFLQTLAKNINERSPQLVLIGCANFWQDELKKNLTVSAKFVDMDNISSAGLKELVSHANVSDNAHVLQAKILDVILATLGTKGAYGIEQLQKAAAMGAIEELLITNTFIAKAKEKNRFAAVEKLLKLVDVSKGKIHLVENKSPIASQVDGLGGIIGSLRFEVE